MTAIASLARYWRTLRHLRAGQIAWRLRRRAAAALNLDRVPAVTPPGAFNPVAMASLRAHTKRFAALAPVPEGLVEQLRHDDLTFLNVTRQRPSPIVWDDTGVPRLWLYHLHGFTHTRTLALANAASPDKADGERFLAWAHDWIEHNPGTGGLAWDPFVVACRLVHWAMACAVFGNADGQIRRSVAAQTAYLQRHIEYDILANHLVKNASALVAAGRLLGSGHAIGRSALRAGLGLLEHELAEQILPDGGHYEGSVMYHAQVLEDCLTAGATLDEPPAWLTDAVARMAGFLARVLHDDGDIPLFADAALNAAAPPRALLAMAATPANPAGGAYALESSGIYVMQARKARMLVKAGSPAPAYQMGHSHCDVASYELTLGGARVVVDSGVRGYEGDPWRAYCRSTRAHNTVSIDGREQLECWSTFRVGRRCRAETVEWTASDAPRLRLGHDAFAPYRHERLFSVHDGRFWVIADTVTGPGQCKAESFIHFHPDVELRQEDGLWTARTPAGAVWIRPFGVDAVNRVQGVEQPRQGWYCPEFGRAIPAPCLILTRQAAGPYTFGYGMFLDASDVLETDALESC